ncbi:MAG: class I SAM-dependent methyltransferase [Sphingomonadales bacterium]|nr:class I SAM-dependent methyltransferase [Sphingomonadales bacterium]MDE2567437.1 class I SAM-dependent methyltransferase [Sphingomonadales bacterium]
MSDPQFEDWSGETGDRWLANIDRFESMIADIGRALIAFAKFEPNESVVDVGCGGGPTTLLIAREILPEGHVEGIDIARQLVERARLRASEDGMTNAMFTVGDAQVASPTRKPVDRLFSRFGVMFFEDTAAAFANMRQWLKPGGRLTFACWASPQDNPWFASIGGVMSQHIEMPERDPAGPGPFRLCDTDATKAMLEGAGFTEVSFTEHAAEQALGGQGAGAQGAADFVLQALDIGPLLAEAGPGVVAKARADLVAEFAKSVKDGSVMLPGKSWFVSARNPG